MVLLKIELSPAEAKLLAARARQQGYDTTDEYLRAVIETLLNNDEDSDAEILADLEDAWREMQHGGGMSVEHLWKFVETKPHS